MSKFVFITSEGETIAPNENVEINNMQVIGMVENAIDKDDALKILLKENSWIWDSGFNVAEFIAYEII